MYVLSVIILTHDYIPIRNHIKVCALLRCRFSSARMKRELSKASYAVRARECVKGF